jgi:hypothetical protein
MVIEAVIAEQDRLAVIWSRRGEGEEALQRELEEALGDLALGLLDDLYPGALDAD